MQIFNNESIVEKMLYDSTWHFHCVIFFVHIFYGRDNRTRYSLRCIDIFNQMISYMHNMQRVYWKIKSKLGKTCKFQFYYSICVLFLRKVVNLI